MRKMAKMTLRSSQSATEGRTAAVEAFYWRCQAKNLSPNTVKFYTYRLRAFLRHMEAHYESIPIQSVTPAMIREFIAHETTHIGAPTGDDSFVALRALFRYLTSEGWVTENPMLTIERPKQKRTLIATFTTEQIQAMLGVCGNDFSGVRNRALIMLLLDCGLRVSELCGIEVADINWSEQTLVVTGKGNKERRVPFGRACRVALMQYFERRGDQLATSAFFLTCYGDPMDRYRVYCALLDCGTKAKVTGVRISPHTFRHTCAVMYLRNGGDVFSLQKLLGHTDLTMTRRYAELSETDVVEKHKLYSPADSIKASQASGRKRMK